MASAHCPLSFYSCQPTVVRARTLTVTIGKSTLHGESDCIIPPFTGELAPPFQSFPVMLIYTPLGAQLTVVLLYIKELQLSIACPPDFFYDD